MKICIVSRGDLSLFPPTEGASFKLFHTLKTLSKFGINVYFVTAENNFYYKIKKNKFEKITYPSLLRKSNVTSFQKRILSFLDIPHDIHPIYHPVVNFKLWIKLLYVTIKEKIDIIQGEFTAFGIPSIFVKLLTGVPVCLVEHNVESFQIPKITKISRNGEKLIRLIERNVCNLSDKVITMTKEEKKRLQIIGVKKWKIEVIPHGVNLEEYRIKESKILKFRKKYNLGFPTLVFHGIYSYKPNLDVINFLANEVIHYLRKKKINAKLLAIGAFPPKNIENPNVIFTGVVRNLPSYLKAADIAVVPIETGGGMKIKTLEYFAAKLPVISTSFGVEGVPVKNGREIIVAKRKEFPKKVEKLIKNKKLREKIKENASLFIKEWSWEKIMKKYVELYGKILG